MKKTAKLILSVGEPAGIGPDITIKIAETNFCCEISALVDPDVLDARAKLLGSDLRCQKDEHGAINFGKLKVLAKHKLSAPLRAGKLDQRNSEYVYNSIKTAATACLSGEYDAMVTAPVHKGIINDAGILFSGHTELLAAVCDKQMPVMLLANKKLRVALLTTHLPLKDVAKRIDADLINDVVTIIHDDLQSKFGIAKPRILVCGLNPHAGESGHLGKEEIEIIQPSLERLRAQGMNIIGPIPADTAFTPQSLKQADVVLAMYHDQGLPVIKSQGFGEIVNITLGLPIIRTSVDHGTALDLAGTGAAKESSLIAAIEQALTMLEVQ